jgi:hypothetical protein
MVEEGVCGVRERERYLFLTLTWKLSSKSKLADFKSVTAE